MKRAVLFFSLVLMAGSIHAQKVFKKYGIDKEPVTLSKGRYVETFTNDEVVQIGTVLLNTKTNKVVKFLDEDTITVSYQEEYASRFVSIDPLAEKYPWLSPYAFCMNNPVRFIDPDGRKIVDATGNVMYANGQWLSNATAGAKLIANSMYSTPSGREAFNNLVKANYGVQLVYDQTSDIGKVGQAARFHDGNGNTTKATITIFEKNLVGELNNLTDLKNSGQDPVAAGATDSQQSMIKEGIPTQSERIGQVGVHEAEHVLNPNTGESGAVKAEIKAIKETAIKSLPIKLKVPEFTFKIEIKLPWEK
ncbi:MAG: hypothetical protein LBN93_11655 [Candidatus Symbiothrix sp.]|jgi:hypothetical protein|nr:hypothetical protein [Candidatus Symbiothrix sp.]